MMSDWQDSVLKVLSAETDDLAELVKIAGGSPRTFFRGANFRDADLTDQPIEAWDLEGADLTHAIVRDDQLQIVELRQKLSKIDYLLEPLLWAMTQNGLGAALHNKSVRSAGPEGAALLAEALDAFRAALRVLTEDAHPLDWAKTQHNLGITLHKQSNLSAEPEGAALLAKAVVAFRAAMRVRTEVAHPLDWATTQNSLGAALYMKGIRGAGPEGAALLAEALTAYRAVLRVRTEHSHPLGWALMQENIAVTEVVLAEHDGCIDSRPHLQAALGAVEDALRVFDPVHTSYNHETASKLRDKILAKLAELDGNT